MIYLLYWFWKGSTILVLEESFFVLNVITSWNFIHEVARFMLKNSSTYCVSFSWPFHDATQLYLCCKKHLFFSPAFVTNFGLKWDLYPSPLQIYPWHEIYMIGWAYDATITTAKSACAWREASPEESRITCMLESMIT